MFVSALTETSLSGAFLSGMNMRLARTHPDTPVVLPELRDRSSEVVDTADIGT